MGTATPMQRWTQPDLAMFESQAVKSRRAWLGNASRLPGSYYLAAAGVTSAASIALKIAGRGRVAGILAQLVAPVLLIGLYDMLMTQSADAASQQG